MTGSSSEPEGRADGSAAIVLAGGAGSRMGGVDKPGLELGGKTLLDRVGAATRAAGCAPVIVVGPEVGGGPAAALAAGLERLRPLLEEAEGRRETDPSWVLVLAGDLVRPELVVELLVSRRPPAAASSAGDCRNDLGVDGTVLVDADGRLQWLAGHYRVAALRAATAGFSGSLDGASMRALLGGLELVRLPADDRAIADIDTWEDYERAKEHDDG